MNEPNHHKTGYEAMPHSSSAKTIPNTGCYLFFGGFFLGI